MKIKHFVALPILLGLPLIGVMSWVLPAQAETQAPVDAVVDAVAAPVSSTTQSSQADETIQTLKVSTLETNTTGTNTAAPSSEPILSTQAGSQKLQLHTINESHLTVAKTVNDTIASAQLEPLSEPGTASTSAKLLLPEDTVAQSFDPNNTTPPAPLTDTELAPGRATRTSYSFIGFGANIGISGSKNALTRDVSFALFSKIGMTPDLSVRPTLLIRDDVYITLPVTFDFSPYVLEGGYRLGPYFGGGLAISTGNSSYVRPLLTAGLDVPLGPQFTGTAGFNFAFFDSVDVGFILGIGYNFRGF